MYYIGTLSISGALILSGLFIQYVVLVHGTNCTTNEPADMKTTGVLFLTYSTVVIFYFSSPTKPIQVFTKGASD
jgi:hypothetical protein